MNKIFSFSIIIPFCFTSLKAQITFQKVYNVTPLNLDAATSFQTTLDGGYVIAGDASNNNFDIFLMKTDANGDSLWSIIYDGLSNEHLYSMQRTNDSGFILGGESTSFFNGESYLLKTDSLGTIQWLKSLDNTGGLTWIEQTQDGSYITSGVTDNAPWEVLITKCNTIGDVVWSKYISHFDLDGCDMIHETSDNGFIMVAVKNLRNFLIKLDSTGTVMWSKHLTRPTAIDPITWPKSVSETSDHGFIITTDLWTSPSTSDIVIIKTDSAGNINWSKHYSAGNSFSSGSVIQNQNGEYLITAMHKDSASSGEDLFIMKTDSTGSVIWSKLYGGSGREGNYAPAHLHLCYTADGGIATISSTTSFGPSTESHSYFVKSDSAGNSGCNESTIGTTVSNIQIIDSLYPINFMPFNTASSFQLMTATYGSCSQTSLCFYDQIDEDANTNIISLFPNPATTEFKIENENSIIQFVKILDLCGRVMYSSDGINSKLLTVDCTLFPPGIYFINVQLENGFVTRKLIID